MTNKSESLYIKFETLELNTQLKKILDKNDITYVVQEDGGLRYPSEHSEFVRDLSLELLSNDLPVGRSMGLKVPGPHQSILDFLESSDIDFITKERFGEVWIVWREKDQSVIDAALDNYDKSFRK
ncbi:hypothetical protein GJS41_02615 [Kangiella sp. HZ709]|nr:hypothetical protein [Kangiella sp. HZ709]